MKINTLQEAKQAAFNGAIRGLASQGWKVCQKQMGHCVLNKGKPGMHCAIGWLIPWSEQEQLANEVNGTEPYSLLNIKKVQFGTPLQEFLNNPKSKEGGIYETDFYKMEVFLNKMQQAHDRSTNSNLKENLKEFGKQYNLSWPKNVSSFERVGK